MFGLAVQLGSLPPTGGTSALGKRLVVVGLTLQLVGAALTFWGLRLAWSDKRGNDRFLDPVKQKLRRGWSVVVVLTRKLFRRPMHVASVGGAITSVAIGGVGRSGSTYPPLAEPEDLASLTVALNQRLDQFSAETSALRNQLADERHRAELAEQHLEAKLASQITERAEQERKLAVSGIRLESGGFFLITVGAVLQAFGSLV